MPDVKKLTPINFHWEKDEEVLDIACGFCHSLVLTNKYVYFFGSIEQGQNPFACTARSLSFQRKYMHAYHPPNQGPQTYLCCLRPFSYHRRSRECIYVWWQRLLTLWWIKWCFVAIIGCWGGKRDWTGVRAYFVVPFVMVRMIYQPITFSSSSHIRMLLPRTTTLYKIFRSLPLISKAFSRARFMKTSTPITMPSIYLPPLSLMRSFLATYLLRSGE